MAEDAKLEPQDEKIMDVVAQPDLNQSAFNAIVKFAEQTEKIGKALDKTRAFFLSRACQGDFVSHNGKTVNVSGPGSERILSSLGLMGVPWSLTDWQKTKDEGNDKYGDWYVHWYSAEAQIGNMKLGRLEGRAGSRDKFFGFKHGSWKDLADVKESDIRIAAHRGVFKELVKVGLGLRNIPIADAVAMGLVENKITIVGYEGADDQAHREATKAGADGGIVGILAGGTLRSGTNKTTKKSYTIYSIALDNGAIAETFDQKLYDQAKALKGKRVTLYTKPNKNPKYAPNLEAIKETPEAAPAAPSEAPKAEGEGLGEPAGYTPGEDA